MAFQVASANEQRMRADVSELVYRARAVSAAGRQKTFIAPLPDYLRCLPVLGPCFGNGCANCGSVEARCSPAVWGCGSLRRHRRNFAGTLTTKTRAGRSRSAVTDLVLRKLGRTLLIFASSSTRVTNSSIKENVSIGRRYDLEGVQPDGGVRTRPVHPQLRA